MRKLTNNQMHYIRENRPITPVVPIGKNPKYIVLGSEHDYGRFISEPRLAKYRQIAKDDEALAMRYYNWNIRLSESLSLPLHYLEVGLRNMVSEIMNKRFGSDWPLHAKRKRDWENNWGPVPELGAGAQDKIVQARNKVRRRDRTPNCVIAQITFGFWRRMFDREYDQTLWKNGVHSVFKNSRILSREDVFVMLRGPVELRNRIAHHEIIFPKDVQKTYKTTIDLIEGMNPNVRDLVNFHSDFPRVLGARPK